MKLDFENKYFKMGVMSFCVVALSILFFFAIYRINVVIEGAHVVIGILRPFIYGLVMAYLLCPIYNRTYSWTYNHGWPQVLKPKRRVVASKLFASIISLVCMFGVVTCLLWMIIPSMIESIVSLAQTLPGDVASTFARLQDMMQDIPRVAGPLQEVINHFVAYFVDFVQATIVPQYDQIITGVSESIFLFAKKIMNLFVGVIICVFFLNRKDIFAAQARKLIFATLKEEKAKDFLFGASFINKTFGGFINGKLIDSLIIGIICFVVMSMFNWPYVMLISVIIGVTNIIPFFGPFIGAIPASLLIFIEDPMTCVYFLIFIFILQQFDGNILGPKILGGTTGLPSFWVMFAILVGGGLFGFVGMVLGIPLFACIYTYSCFAINKRLTKKGYKTDLEVYKAMEMENGVFKAGEDFKIDEGNK